MCDGNAKIFRRICAAPQEKIKLARNMPSIVTVCPNSPAFGGKNCSSSVYCEDHLYLEQADKTTDTDQPPSKLRREDIKITINIKEMTVKQSQLSSVQNLPGNEDHTVHVACKKPENSTVYHKRTAGFMFIVRPCGVIIDFREMFTSESPSQLFVQLLQLCDEDNTNIKYISYDRACEFTSFLTNLAKKGNPGAAKLLNLKFLVDRFHIKGHTTPECDIKVTGANTTLTCLNLLTYLQLILNVQNSASRGSRSLSMLSNT